MFEKGLFYYQELLHCIDHRNFGHNYFVLILHSFEGGGGMRNKNIFIFKSLYFGEAIIFIFVKQLL